MQGLSELFVSSAEEALNVIEIGDKCRSVAHTQMNAASSRSHSVFMLNITQRQTDGSSTVSRLNLADLAGSEQVKKTGATGQTLEEAKKINQSLSALGNCINALTEARPYVPYRDSKLTHLLRESLGGNTKSNLIVCCSPHSFNLEETVSTLRFAQRAKTIKTTVKQNIVRSRKELEQMIERLKHEVSVLKKGGSIKAMTDDQEDALFACQEQLARAQASVEELTHRVQSASKDKTEAEERQEELADRFEQYQKASVDKLKFFQSQYDAACTTRDRYRSELERAQAETQRGLHGDGKGGAAAVAAAAQTVERLHGQVRELLEEKTQGVQAFKEMEAAALRMQEDIIKRCAERDTLLERISVLETSVAELNTRNEELEKMLCRLFLSGTCPTDGVTAVTGSYSSLVPPACS
jgi:DNA repair exonuclease SbcCD ATPase subunit